jgi:GNAT superfamily N-acetyltransferase
MIELKSYSSPFLKDLLHLFHDTIHHVNASDYDPEQLEAWAPGQSDENSWHERLHKQYTQLAWVDQKLVGFASLDHTGLIDFLYVSRHFQRQGIAQLLFLRLEFEARQMKMERLFTEASITAMPFFEKMGFELVFPQEKEVRGVVLKNFVMEKFLR